MHNQFMQAAFAEANLGRGLCAPNPSVGAVLVADNVIIAKAYHQGTGKPHAEQLVLDQIKDRSKKDVTLYVTLEPCNHWGRTPPCIKGIIEAGIKRVVYAYADPNPVVAQNNTPFQLEQANIEVIHFPLPEINAFYESYLYWTKYKRPWVTVKMAQTLDGKIASAGGMPLTLSNEKCAEFTHLKRLQTDTILTTAKTILTDNPALTARSKGETRAKDIAILDRTLQLPSSQNIFKTAKSCTIYHDQALSAPSRPGCRYHGISTVNGQLNLDEILQDLGEQGVHDVWVEAGGTLFTALHLHHLVQRTYLYIVPTVLPEGFKAYQAANIFTKPFKLTPIPAEDNVIMCFDWM